MVDDEAVARLTAASLLVWSESNANGPAGYALAKPKTGKDLHRNTKQRLLATGSQSLLGCSDCILEKKKSADNKRVSGFVCAPEGDPHMEGNMVQHILAILVVIVASLLRAMDLLALGSFEYNQVVTYSDPLVQLAAVSAVFIAVKAGPGAGVAMFAVFILLTLVWTFSLGSLGFQV